MRVWPLAVLPSVVTIICGMAPCLFHKYALVDSKDVDVKPVTEITLMKLRLNKEDFQYITE